MQHFTPHPYQQAAIDAIIDKPSVGLWMEMGLGKTVVTLTAIDTLIYDAAEIRRVLVVAPKKVAEATWQDEAQKWDHLQHLRISTVLGTEAQRIAALNTPADVYIINRETKRIDPGSFIVMLQANEVEGEGFKRLELGEQS